MIKKSNLVFAVLSILFFGLIISSVSAATWGPNGADYALCTEDGSSSDFVCTNQVVESDSAYVNMDENEEIQLRWDSDSLNIPSYATISQVIVSVYGYENNPQVTSTIQLWSANNDNNELTNSQSYSNYNWDTLFFEDSRLTNEVAGFISNEEDVELEVDFEGYSGSNNVIIDYVKLKVVFSDVDNNDPVCSVDLLGSYGLVDSITYIADTGSFTIFGTANDSESGVDYDTLQANRSSDDEIGSRYWLFGDVDLGIHDQNNAIWYRDFQYSPSKNNYYDEGLHTVCCELDDEYGNHFDGACKDICLDETAPAIPEVENTNIFNCEVGYTNEDITFNWTNIINSDEGCAPVSYELELYVNGVLADTITTTSHTFNVDSIYDLTNEYNYSIRVRAVDEAGNNGSWSAMSMVVVYDDENPQVTITGLPWDASANVGYAWYNSNFNVTELDTDNFGIYKVEYKVRTNGTDIVDWTEISENETVEVLVPEECFISGLNVCIVSKRVTDLACNTDNTWREFDIDLEAPTTTKEVLQPKYTGRFFEWLGEFFNVDWFVTDAASLTFSCDDNDLSGCNSTYYIIYNQTGAVVMQGEGANVPLSGLADGIYNVTYYSVDNVGNVEALQSEIDKVDTIAPETTKTIGEPKYNDGEKLWVTSNTEFNLTCVDSEVGCNSTWFSVQGPQFGYGVTSPANPMTFHLSGEDGEYYVEYGSVDHLGNQEIAKNETDWLDNTAPGIIIYNPLVEQEENKCSLDVVTEMWEFGSGLNESTTVAVLINDSGAQVGSILLTKVSSILGDNSGYYYTGVMPLADLPAGDYTVIINASDNLGNTNSESRVITLLSGITVERIAPSSCSIGDSGGNCSFSFQLCVRDSSAVSMWVTKLYTVQGGQRELVGVADPFTLNARITNNQGTAQVGLTEEPYGRVPAEGEVLNLTSTPCEKINGRVNGAFDLKMDFNEEVAQAIGTNSYLFDFDLQAYNYDDECIVDED